MVLFGVTVK